jgi:hypothetical protein
MRDIERYCPDKWKKKTKPKNDKLSFSKPTEQKPQQQIAVTQDGKSVINDTSTNTQAYPISYDGINELHDQSKQNGIGTNADNQRTADIDTKEELVVMHPLNGETVPVNKQNEDLTDRQERKCLFEGLQKDMDAVSQITTKVGNIFFEVLVDLGTPEVKIEFCGITQHTTMTSTGKGVLQEAN